LDSHGSRIEAGSPRELFARWVAEACARTRPAPSDLAAAYLVDLLAGRLRAPAGPTRETEATLAEAWLIARGAEGARRVERLRAVGDHALFVAGFFGESLTRKVVGIAYYRDIGQAAYDDLSSWLTRGSWDGTWGGLYRELAERFTACLEVLASVGERARSDRASDLLHLHERWLATGSETVRRRLLARGCLVGPASTRSIQ
jgi:hypothetical protein